VSVNVSNGYEESMNTVAFLTNVELSPADSHVSKLCSCTNPELHISVSWCVDDEFVLNWIINCCCLDASHIASMCHFGKSERSNVFDFHHTLDVGHVLFSTDAHEGLAVETEMHTVFHRHSGIP
jgi:hypothetical protein